MRLEFTFPGNGGPTVLSIPDAQLRKVMGDLLASNPGFREIVLDEIRKCPDKE